MSLDQNNTITGKMSSIGQLVGEISIFSGESTKEKYEGDYTIAPSTEEDIVLVTKDKLMTDDLTLKKIPFHETSNDSGGITVYIGKEVEISYG